MISQFKTLYTSDGLIPLMDWLLDPLVKACHCSNPRLRRERSDPLQSASRQTKSKSLLGVALLTLLLRLEMYFWKKSKRNMVIFFASLKSSQENSIYLCLNCDNCKVSPGAIRLRSDVGFCTRSSKPRLLRVSRISKLPLSLNFGNLTFTTSS